MGLLRLIYKHVFKCFMGSGPEFLVCCRPALKSYVEAGPKSISLGLDILDIAEC